MRKSMLEYLAELRQYGHTPKQIGDVTIGRTVYAAGEFFDTSREELRIALMPMYRIDWVSYDSAGPTPKLVPASYERNQHTVYADNFGNVWYISGWHIDEDVLWLNRADDNHGCPTMQIDVHWKESFDVSMRLAGPEVLARINQQ